MALDADLETKVRKLAGGEEFMEEVMGLTVAQLEARITTYQKELDESEEHKKNNEALKEAKGEVAVIEGPYKDVKKAVQVKTKYLIELIKEKGGQ